MEEHYSGPAAGKIGGIMAKTQEQEQDTQEYKLSLALNEAITLIQMAAKEIEGGDENCLKEMGEGLKD